MRLSSDRDHPDYKPLWMGCLVFLDGELVDHCVHVDTEAGKVTVAVVDPLTWRIKLDPVSGEVLTMVRRGAVRVSNYRVDAPKMGFDAWMRRRTNEAHKEMMAHARLGGIAYQPTEGSAP